MAAPTSTTTSSRAVKKVGSGKENAPPPRKGRADVDNEDDLDRMSEDDEGGKKANSRSASVSVPKGKPLSSKRGADDDGDVHRNLSAITAERDRLRTQRDTFSKQFEELSKTRSTDIEGLFEKYKSKAETASKTQNEIIANQTALTEKLQAKVQALEKALAASKETLPSAGGPFEASSSAKADPKEIKALKEELGKIKADAASKDQKIAELQREYKAEVEHSRSLQASAKSALSSLTTATGAKATSQTTAAVSLTPEEAEKDAASLALYEDLTMLNIINVKIKPGKYNTKESTFNCVLAMNEKSLNFKLRCFTDIDRSADKPTYVKTVHYTPELLEHESQAFVKRLDYFANQFVVPRDQLGGFLAELRLKLELDEEE